VIRAKGIILVAAAGWLAAFAAEDKPATEYSLADWRALPLSLSLWSLIGPLGAASAVEPADFGGLTAARLPYYAAEAASWTRTRYRLNRLDLADPYQPGKPIFFVDLGSAERVLDGGGSVSVLTRAGEADWRGRIGAELTGRALSDSNLSDLALRAGFLRPERFRWFTQDRLELTGGLGGHADLFVSATGRWASQSIPREPELERLNTRLLTATAASRLRLGRRDRLRAAYTGSRIHLGGFAAPAAFEALLARRMAPPFEFHPTQGENNRMDSIQAAWLREAAPTSAFEMRYGSAVARLNTSAPPPEEPRIDLATGRPEGAPALASRAVRSRQALGALIRREPTLRGGRARLSAEAEWQRASFQNRLIVPGDGHRLFVGSTPVSFVYFNTPLDSRGRFDDLKLAFSGYWEASRWLSLAAGVVSELARGSLPEQSSPPGRFRPARRFDSRPGVLAWNDAAPWLAIRLSPAATLSLGGRYRRSLQPVAGRYLDYANRNSLSGHEYRAADGLLVRRFGGEFSQIDPQVRRPYTDEFGVDAHARLPGALESRLRLFRRDDRRRLVAINTGVPFAAYRPVSIEDPGEDFILGTFDDGRLVVYEQDPLTFGQDSFLLTNARVGSMSAGLAAELGLKRNPYWWRLNFAAVKGYATTNPGNAPWENDPGVVGSLLADPNTLVHATGRVYFDRAYLASLSGGARLPRAAGALEIGWVVSYRDGLAFGRRLLVEGLSQGPLVVMATPRGSPEGGHRTKYNLLVDVRLSRRVSVGRRGLLLWADIFNLPNVGYATRERDMSGPEFKLRLPVSTEPPRFLRLGIEVSF